MKLLGASLMAADPLRLGAQIQTLERENIDYYHIDIMDGQFVANFALNIELVKALRPVTRRTLEVHLMVEHPERYISAVAAAGADIITLHAEATRHLQGALAEIKQHKVKAGVALNPATPVKSLEYVAGLIDVLLLMTVNPGANGQHFIEAMYDKIAYARMWLGMKNEQARLAVEGNISPQTITQCAAVGADMLVLGSSSLFRPDGRLEQHLRATRALVNGCNTRLAGDEYRL